MSLVDDFDNSDREEVTAPLLLRVEGESGGEQISFVDMERLGSRVTGQKIRIRRKNRHMTQKQLAEMAGVKQTDVSSAERTPEATSLKVFLAICRAFNITVHQLMEQNTVVVNGMVRPKDVYGWKDQLTSESDG